MTLGSRLAVNLESMRHMLPEVYESLSTWAAVLEKRYRDMLVR